MIRYEDEIIQFLHRPTGCLLWAPRSFLAIDPDELPLLYNGCGPDGILRKVIPQKILGLPIGFLCYIHDHMYGRCCCEADEDICDAVFAANLNIWISHNSGWFLKLPRYVLSAKFQHTVSITIFSKSYWKDNRAVCPTGRRYALPVENYGTPA